MRRLFLNTLCEKLEAALTAAAFAEENDAETAREFLPRQADPAGRRGVSAE